jgi:hypothetical protein
MNSKIHLWRISYNSSDRNEDGTMSIVYVPGLRNYVLTNTTDVAEAKHRIERDVLPRCVSRWVEILYLGEVVNDIGHDLGLVDIR